MREKAREPQTPRKSTPDTILIKKSDTSSYAKILKKVKDEVIAKGLEDNITSVRETKKGDLIITLGKKENGNEQLRTAIASKMGKTNVTTRRRTTDTSTFQIKGIDAVTTREEIEAALRKEVETAGGTPHQNIREVVDNYDSLRQTIQVVALRPGFAGSQTAVVTVNKTAAKILGKKQTVKIGLPNCKLKERIKIDSCFRCSATGHTTKTCTGPDRSKACKNCGEEKHERKNCQNASRCVICGKDHPANTWRCQAFREEIRKAICIADEHTPRNVNKQTKWRTPTNGTPNTPDNEMTNPASTPTGERQKKRGKEKEGIHSKNLEDIQLIELNPRRLTELKEKRVKGKEIQTEIASNDGRRWERRQMQ